MVTIVMIAAVGALAGGLSIVDFAVPLWDIILGAVRLYLAPLFAADCDVASVHMHRVCLPLECTPTVDSGRSRKETLDA